MLYYKGKELVDTLPAPAHEASESSVKNLGDEVRVLDAPLQNALRPGENVLWWQKQQTPKAPYSPSWEGMWQAFVYGVVAISLLGSLLRAALRGQVGAVMSSLAFLAFVFLPLLARRQALQKGGALYYAITDRRVLRVRECGENPVLFWPLAELQVLKKVNRLGKKDDLLFGTSYFAPSRWESATHGERFGGMFCIEQADEAARIIWEQVNGDIGRPDPI